MLKMLVRIALFSSVALSSSSPCTTRASCSNHGNCVNQRCVCDAHSGWYGLDCSAQASKGLCTDTRCAGAAKGCCEGSPALQNKTMCGGSDCDDCCGWVQVRKNRRERGRRGKGGGVAAVHERVRDEGRGTQRSETFLRRLSWSLSWCCLTKSLPHCSPPPRLLPLLPLKPPPVPTANCTDTKCGGVAKGCCEGSPALQHHKSMCESSDCKVLASSTHSTPHVLKPCTATHPVLYPRTHCHAPVP